MSPRIEAVTSSRGPDFAEAYAALSAEFEPRGELERREVVSRWLEEATPVPAQAPDGVALLRSYHLLVARDGSGALAGVRDFHLVYDAKNAVAITYLAHVLVLPAHRRSGLAERFRSEPVELSQRAIEALGADLGAVDLLLAAEMEPADPAELSSLVRLVAYGKAGFAAIAPTSLPYCQPDFRLLDSPATDEAEPRRVLGARAIPLLAVVRWVGHEGATSVPRRLARAFMRHLYAVFATHVRADHLAALMARTLIALDASPLDDVPLVRLPRAIDDHDALEPLSRASVLPLFPAELR